MNNYQEEATNNLVSCVGKYITVHHKYFKKISDHTYSEDICVAKVIAVTRAQFLSLPKIKLLFCNGQTAELTYSFEYKSQLMLHWDYTRQGRRFNDMFITWTDDGWDYTYPDSQDAKVDYFLTTGDLFVKFFENDTESKDTIVFYNQLLKEVSDKRECERRMPKTTPLPVNNTVPTAELDKLFLARA